MNNIRVTITQKGIKKYPLHKHNNWEIMHYVSGTGHLATEKENIPFQKGSIIIVPPKTVHGSVSENGFVNISVSGDFNHLLMFEKTTVLKDNSSADGETLAKLIFNNRYSSGDYLSALCTAYITFVLQNAEYENNVSTAVAEIIKAITENFSALAFDVTQLLNKSGYAEDYIRSEFKKITSLTPVQFLTKLRIENAQKLFEIYGKSITVSEVAEVCGFSDTIYFSKRFKQCVGLSPDAYRKQII